MAVSRRAFVGSAFALPLAGAGQQQLPTEGRTVAKVPAGTGRFNEVVKLPGGNPLYVKVATEETGGAFFMAEQPSGPRGAGPPKHFHENVDEC